MSAQQAQAPDGRSLVGRTVRLDAAHDHDAEELFEALRDDQVWASGYNGGVRPNNPSGWRRLMESAALAGRVMYVVRTVKAGTREPDRVVGTTSLGDLDLKHERVHLGWTAYSPDVWGTSVNPECKLLLLGHCFDHCHLGRVKIQTDGINQRSQAAIAKLGATREGVLRHHMRRADGSWRDTVVFSVIAEEWPVVRDGLELRLSELSAGTTSGAVSGD